MTDFAMTEQDYDRLAEILDGFPSDDAMTLEELDGFLAALACNLSEVPPEDYLPELWGAVEEDAVLFPDIEGAREFVSLVTRHFGAVMVRLAEEEEEFVPLLLEDEDGAVTGNDWAQGFLRGMDLDREAWRPLLEDEGCAGILIPIFALACEHSPDPELRPFEEPVDEEQRELLLSGIGGAARLLYEYFAPVREGNVAEGVEEDEAQDEKIVHVAPRRRDGPKIGRNEPCPCGSGKKYKRCCGADGA